MTSQILGRIKLDDHQLRRDLKILDSIARIPEEYDEYSSGYWQNCSLWNASGDATDTMYREFDHPAKQTEHGRRHTYLDRVIRDNFARFSFRD